MTTSNAASGGPTAFLFVADTSQSGLDSLLPKIDGIREVENWFKFLPGAAILISSCDVNHLHELLRRTFPSQRYLLVHLEKGGQNGWLPSKVWDFMNQPRAADAPADVQAGRADRRYGTKATPLQGVAEPGRPYRASDRGKVG